MVANLEGSLMGICLSWLPCGINSNGENFLKQKLGTSPINAYFERWQVYRNVHHDMLKCAECYKVCDLHHSFMYTTIRHDEIIY